MRAAARLAALVLALGTAATPAGAATLVRDLGQGLTYFRVHDLPGDQPSPPSGRPGACVIDLRFAKSDDASAATFRAWVTFNLSAHTPVFILENTQTDAALLAALPGGAHPGLFVLAPISARISPDIAVHVTEDADKKAYDALEKGADVGSLLSDYPDKPRIDEAYLEKEHIADSDAPDEPTDKPAPPVPLTDPMLQRAVQLHRGLLALRRI
jgi:hypothetical protein